MNVLAGQPKQGWFSRAIEDFKGQSPMEQIGSMVKVVGFVTILVGAASTAWAYAPSMIHYIGSQMVTATTQPPEENIQEAKEQKSDVSKP